MPAVFFFFGVATMTIISIARTPTTAPIIPHTTGGSESKNPDELGITAVVLEVVLSAVGKEPAVSTVFDFTMAALFRTPQSLFMFPILDGNREPSTALLLLWA